MPLGRLSILGGKTRSPVRAVSVSRRQRAESGVKKGPKTAKHGVVAGPSVMYVAGIIVHLGKQAFEVDALLGEEWAKQGADEDKHLEKLDDKMIGIALKLDSLEREVKGVYLEPLVLQDTQVMAKMMIAHWEAKKLMTMIDAMRLCLFSRRLSEAG